MIGYQPLMIHPQLSRDGVQLVRDVLDPQLADVHAMLRLPLPHDEGLSAGCNFAVTTVLLAIVSGISVTLFRFGAKRSGSGKAFRDLLVGHYPWDQEFDSGALKAKAAADALYELFRNPLVHELGITSPHKRVEGRMLSVVKDPMSEAEIVDLEMAQPEQMPWREPTLKLTDNVLSLWVPSLYWGVREMIERVL